jgi:hypothetical protein
MAAPTVSVGETTGKMFCAQNILMRLHACACLLAALAGRPRQRPVLLGLHGKGRGAPATVRRGPPTGRARRKWRMPWWSIPSIAWPCTSPT